MDRRPPIDIDTIKRRVSVVEAVQAFCPGIRLRRQGVSFVALSPFKAERTPSFTIDPRKNVFYCFASDQGGDAVRFVERLLGVPFPEAARALAERCLGHVPQTDGDRASEAARDAARQAEHERIEAREASERAARLQSAHEIWDQSRPARGTLAEVYLTARGIDFDAIESVYGWRMPASLRFHPALPARTDHGWQRLPAMVGAVTDDEGRFTAIHRTFLALDGLGKARLPNAKLTLGPVWGAMGVLSPIDGADHAVIGEGYETTLTVMAAMARRGLRLSAVSGLNLNNIAGGGLGQGHPHPAIKGRRIPSERPDPDKPGLTLPSSIKRVTLLEDADGSDRISITARYARAIAKFRAAGHRVRIATPELGTDFNDMAKGRAA